MTALLATMAKPMLKWYLSAVIRNLLSTHTCVCVFVCVWIWVSRALRFQIRGRFPFRLCLLSIRSVVRVRMKVWVLLINGLWWPPCLNGHLTHSTHSINGRKQQQHNNYSNYGRKVFNEWQRKAFHFWPVARPYKRQRSCTFIKFN